MPPAVLQAGFRLGVLIALLAALTLPFQDPASAEFVVTVLALAIGLAFAGGIAVLARLSNEPLPRDKAGSSRYNSRDHGRGSKE